jgi:WD40 repeat protein/serine/threonine protein kinase
MGAEPESIKKELPVAALEHMMEVCDRYEQAWRAGLQPRIEDCLAGVAGTEQAALLHDLVAIDVELRRGRGEEPTSEEYRDRFPDHGAVVASAVAQGSPTERSERPARTAGVSRSNDVTGVNLLLGILALQNNFVGRTALLAAFNAWVADKSRPLGQILVDQGAIDRARHELLEALVQEHLKLHDHDPEKSLADLSAIGSVKNELQSLGDHGLAVSLSHVSTSRGDSDDSGGATMPWLGSSSSAGTRFRILRQHARGGLGQVYVALDEELHREVALKEIQPHHADEPVSRSRFVQEAEITGGLEHPGIVPVYGLGFYGNGRPFYAMRLVKGDNLKSAVKAFHGSDKERRGNAGERSLALRRLLGRFLDVCNAVAYAHSRGVLHRDLKPGNVLLGPFGETLVVDWGLAKVVGRAEASSQGSERTLHPASSSAVEGTLPHSALGTPGYMSPEQADGQLDRLGPCSDVYSLGATLYYLLTGHSPFPDNEVAEVLERTRRGAFPPPRAVRPDAPRALEAICMKAMALKPEDRHQSPRELADDIEHWLADEPVSACPDRWGDRLARWTRRHRTWVQSGVAALLLISVVSVGSALLVNEARRKAEEQRRQVLKLSGDVTSAYHRVRAERDRSARFASDLALQKGRTLGDQGEIDAALLWIANALALDPNDEKAGSQRTIRENFASWSHQVGFRLKSVFSLDIELKPTDRLSEPRAASFPIALGPGGKSVVTARGNTATLWNTEDGSRLGASMIHAGPITAVAFSPDGTSVLTASEDRTARVWSAGDGQPVGEPINHQHAVQAIAFSPDGKSVLTASEKTVQLWSTADGQPIGKPIIHQDAVTTVAFSPDGKTLLTVSNYNRIAHLWQSADEQPVGKPINPVGRVMAVAFSPDGKSLLTTTGMTFHLWDAASGESLRPRTPITAMAATPPSSCEFLTYSPDGKSILSVSSPRAQLLNIADRTRRPPAEDRTVQLISLIDGRPKMRPITCRGSGAALVFSPDGATFLTVSEDRAARLWARLAGGTFDPGEKTQIIFSLDKEKPEIIRKDVTPLAFSPMTRAFLTTGSGTTRLWRIAADPPVGQALPSTDPIQAAVFSADGQSFFTLSGDGTLRLWSTALRQPIGRPLTHHGPAAALAFSPDGKSVVTTRQDSTLQVWSAADGQPVSKPVSVRGSSPTLVFGPDGRTIVVRSDATTAQLLDAASGQPIGKPIIHQDRITAVTFSPDGKTLLTASNDKTARLWSAADGQSMGNPMSHQGPVSGTAFSPDGKTILTVSDYRTARLWSATDGQPIGVPITHEANISAFAFSPDSRLVLTGSYDLTARLWNAADGKAVGQSMPQEGPVRALAFSRDGTIVLTRNDKAARLWNAADGLAISSPITHENAIVSAYFSRDGKTVVTHDDKVVRLWSTADGQPVGKPITHGARLRATILSADAKTLVTGSEDKTARLWNASLGEPIGQPMAHSGPVVSVALGPYGQTVLTRSDQDVRLWDVALGRPIGKPIVHEGPVIAAVFSRDGKSILTHSRKSVRLWNAATALPIGKPMTHQSLVSSAAFSPDGKTIQTRSIEYSAQFWTAAGQPVGAPMGHEGSINAVAFSPDGKTLLTRSGKAVCLWNVASGQPIGEPMNHDEPVLDMAFSPDARTVLTRAGKTVRVWNAATAQPAGKPFTHQDAVTAAAFSPDGRTIATSADNTTRLWNPTLGQPIGKPIHHQGRVTSLVFSPDARALLSASDDRTARLWDAATGQPIGKPMTHPGPALSAAFSPDGRTILTSTARGKIYGQFFFWSAADGSPVGQPEEGVGNYSDKINIIFYDNSRKVFIYNNFYFKDWRVPSPLEGIPTRLRLWAEVVTGTALNEENIVQVLDAPAWQERRRELDALGGPPPL